MNTIELFAGTQSFSKVMKEHNHKTYCIDNDPKFNNDLNVDILNLKVWMLPKQIDIMWSSPPCTTFSIASCGTHWTKDKKPKTKKCEVGLELLRRTVRLIWFKNPKYWFIENPRGIMRKVIDDIFKENGIKDYHRVTVWYCQYGDTRAKPTDIWTNLKGWSGKQCKNNSIGCNHERAPRGSHTGTQGLKNAIERSEIPSQLFKEILKYIEMDRK